MSVLFLICCFAIMFIIAINDHVYPADFTDYNITRAIIGEASGEGELGMYAVASAILNRGTLNGVYGLNAKHVDSQPQYVWKRAYNALEKAKARRLHSGNYWGSTVCDTKWIKTMQKAGYTEVFRYRNQVFYKGV